MSEDDTERETEPATEKEKMIAGKNYDPLDPELTAARDAARQLTGLYNDTGPHEEDRRRLLLEELLGSGGETAWIEPPLYCDYGWNIHVGEHFYANFGCVFLDVSEIRFGDQCLLGPGVHVYTAAHPIDAETRADGPEWGESVEVGDRVWIGGRAVINPGVTIGDDVVVAAGSVVVDDVPDNVVVGGNPAEVIRDLE